MSSGEERSGLIAILWGCCLLLLVCVSYSRAASSLPTVIDAQVPFYPVVVQKAHIEGLVRLRVTTDGARPSSVSAIDGQPMLCAAAIENVKTWAFEPHEPTTFQVSFHYRLLPAKCDSKCNCQSEEAPSVTLRLPTEIEVKATEVKICDPVEHRP